MICTKNMCIYRIFLKQSNYFLIWQQVKHVVCVTVVYPYIIFSKMVNKFTRWTCLFNTLVVETKQDTEDSLCTFGFVGPPLPGVCDEDRGQVPTERKAAATR